MDGAEAIEVILNDILLLHNGERSSYALILMDCQMPVMNGYDATRAIRSSGSPWASVVIVAMTASVMQRERERCAEVGMDDYLPKPLQHEDHIAMTYKWLVRGSEPG